MKFIQNTLVALILSWVALSAEPTEVRTWRSTSGHKIEAAALRYKDGMVQLKTTAGRLISVKLSKLVRSDQELIRDHFDADSDDTTSGSDDSDEGEYITDGLPHPIGQISQKIDAGGGSSYYVYLPSTLRKDRKTALLFFTNSGGGGNGRLLNKLKKGAEVNGWIIAISVESKNGQAFEINHAHSKRCVQHILKNLPVDKKRLYFSGNSGGGATSLFNVSKFRAAGGMPCIGYIPSGIKMGRCDLYVQTGARDYNRYPSAIAAAGQGKNGYHRLYTGGHNSASSEQNCDGMAWLNGKYLSRNKSSQFTAIREDYERSMIKWIQELESSEPHRAYYWCDFLESTYKIKSSNKVKVSQIKSKLASDPNNVKYAEGMNELNEFSKKNYATGPRGGSAMNHTSPKIQSAAKRFQAKYKGVPDIEAVAKELGQATVGG